jgi:hypothetical protein
VASIKVLSREPNDPNFLRPPKGSPLARGGAGVMDPALPAWVGAVAPEGVAPWDWDKTWKMLARQTEAPLEVMVGDAPPELSKVLPVLDEDFKDPANSRFGSHRDEAEGYDCRFETGRYVMRLFPRPRHPVSHWACFGPGVASTEGDFACQVVGRIMTGGDHFWALGLWTPAKDRHLTIRLRRNGAVEVGNLFWNKEGEVKKVGPIRHRAIRPGNRDNTLLVVVRGGRRMEIYVNGAAVSRSIQLEPPLGPRVCPGVGLWQRSGVQGEGRAEFSRFTVWKLPR